MEVHAYTFRNEYHHLNWNYGQDPYNEYETYLNMGLDGYFTDFPASAKRFLDWQKMKMTAAGSGKLSVSLVLLPLAFIIQFLS